ncbi:MAG TPA: molybdopterin-guanine dinucleotide biosynthesis protein B [Paracoccaceae bacterium]|nr:molybdopterin-guanine dinucleotide biosynthesis protein B [Paracoccaceae bacterium]
MKVYGVTGWKNAGKTTLVERLVTEISGRGLTVSTIKHAHHSADIDEPGRDSFRHREAGAREVILATPDRWALMHELRGAPEPKIEDLIARLAPVDLVLIEGFKRAPHPKIEAHREEMGHPLMANENPTIRAVASDISHIDVTVPVFDLDDIRGIADFILSETSL